VTRSTDDGLASLIHSAFETQAILTPDAAAAVSGTSVITYAELDQRANAIARELAVTGAAPDSIVAIALPPSIQQLVAVLGVLKAGAACLPVDLGQPLKRQQFVVANAKPVALVAAPDQARAMGVSLPLLTVAEAKLSNPPMSGTQPQNLAYVVYTSGSTGQPKGVAMPHRALANLLTWQASPRSLGNHPARTLYRAMLAFDVSFQELFGTWATGGTVVVADENDRRDPRRLWDLIARERIERIFLPFTMLQEIARAADQAMLRRVALKEIVSSGERIVLTPDIRRMFGSLKNARLVCQYGPSETHVVTEYNLTGDVARWPVEAPIGYPIDNVTIRLLTDDLQVPNAGEPGEICVGGSALYRGYLGKPAMTAAQNLPDSCSPVPGSLLYRTGDLGRYLDDGALEFAGRIDNQVKIRGARVEPGEVEVRLSQHEGVVDCAVTAVRHSDGTHDLVAYFVPGATPPTVGSLREFIAASLPDYMIPAHFVSVSALPRTSSGKVDRLALPDLTSARPSLDVQYLPPSTAVEQMLADIYSEILGVCPVGVHDDFFELGGNSIRAMRMSIAMTKQADFHVPIEVIFESRTVAAIARYIAATGHATPPLDTNSTISSASVSPMQVSRHGRPSPGQEQLLALCHFFPEASIAYQDTLTFWCRGPLNVRVLENAVSAIIQRHDALRTRFTRRNGSFQVSIVDDASARIPVTDCSANSPAQIVHLAEAFAREAIDLATSPPIRMRLYRHSSNDSLFVIVIHHVVWDARSAILFESELRMEYEKAGLSPPGGLAGLPRLLDLNAWLQQRQDSVSMENTTELRGRVLAGVPPVLTLPTSQPRPQFLSFRGGMAVRVLDSDAERRLSRLVAVEGATIPAAVLTLFGAVLSRWSGQSSFLLGITVHDRPLPSMENVIGYYVNTVPIHIQVLAGSTFRSLLGRVRDEVLAAIQAPHIPLRRLVSSLHPDRNHSIQRPLIQVIFADQGEKHEPWHTSEISFTPATLHNGTAKFDLTLKLERSRDIWQLGLEYDSELFSEVVANQILDWINETAVAAAREPDAPIGVLQVDPPPGGLV
jgi:surfactin family lipopeptide synthetase A